MYESEILHWKAVADEREKRYRNVIDTINRHIHEAVHAEMNAATVEEAIQYSKEYQLYSRLFYEIMNKTEGV